MSYVEELKHDVFNSTDHIIATTAFEILNEYALDVKSRRNIDIITANERKKILNHLQTIAFEGLLKDITYAEGIYPEEFKNDCIL